MIETNHPQVVQTKSFKSTQVFVLQVVALTHLVLDRIEDFVPAVHKVRLGVFPSVPLPIAGRQVLRQPPLVVPLHGWHQQRDQKRRRERRGWQTHRRFVSIVLLTSGEIRMLEASFGRFLLS